MFDEYLSAYQTTLFKDDQGRPIEYLTPRRSFDSAICGVCARSGRLIYSKWAVLEIIQEDLITVGLASNPRRIIPLELARDALEEAALRFNVLILGPSEESNTSPLFLDEDRP